MARTQGKLKVQHIFSLLDASYPSECRGREASGCLEDNPSVTASGLADGDVVQLVDDKTALKDGYTSLHCAAADGIKVAVRALAEAADGAVALGREPPDQRLALDQGRDGSRKASRRGPCAGRQREPPKSPAPLHRPARSTARVPHCRVGPTARGRCAIRQTAVAGVSFLIVTSLTFMVCLCLLLQPASVRESAT
jgi:hypothetical protein